MKTFKTIIAATIAVLTVNTMNAQLTNDQPPLVLKPVPGYNNMAIGFKVLPGFATFSMKTYNGETTQGEATHGYGYGISIEKNWSKNLGTEMDFIYSAFSKKYQDGNLKRLVNVNYVNIPLLLTLSTNKSIPISFNVVAGPQIGLNAGSNTKITSGTSNDSTLGVLSLKQMDIAIAYGAGLDFSFSKSKCVHVGIGYRGSSGLTTMNTTNNGLAKGSYFIINGSQIITNSGYLSVTFGF